MAGDGNVPEKLYIPAADLEGFEFVDYGSHVGNSFRLAQSMFAAGRGLGIDSHPDSIASLKSQGIAVLERDAAEVRFPPGAFSFAVLSHFLEHLPNLRTVETLIENVAAASRDFLFIKQPFFDEDAYLAHLGLKTVSFGYDQHTCHMRIQELLDIFLRQGLRDFVIWGYRPWQSSLSSDQILPMTARYKWSLYYDPNTMEAKEDIAFERPVFEEIICLVRLSRSEAVLRAQDAIESRFGEDIARIIEYRYPASR